MAEQELARLVVRLEAESTQLRRQLDQIDGRMKTTADVARDLQFAFRAIIGSAVVRELVQNSVEAQRATAQLQAVLKSTGGVAGQTMASLDAMATSLQRATAYEDEAVKGAQALLLTFTNIKGATFEEATKAVLDMATAMGTDLKSAAIQVGKALQDPILGVTALRRVGVNFNTEQLQVIKNLVETGRAAEAQTLILKELSREFGGSAAAARDTLGGALTGLKNAFGDLLEVSREATGPVIGFINGVTAALEKLNEVRQKTGGGILTGAGIPGMEALARVLEHYREQARGPQEFYGPQADNTIKMLDGITVSVKKLTEAEKELARQHRLMLNQGAGVSAPTFRPTGDISVDPEVVARWQMAQENLRTGAVQIFDLKPLTKRYKVAMDDAIEETVRFKDRALEAAVMFRDGFADAVASAVMTGKLSFKSFADFVIAELIRIQARRFFTDVLGAVANTTSATVAGVPVVGNSSAISAPSFNLAPASAPATVVHQTVNFSVSAVDSRDAARFIQEQKGTIAGVVAEAARSSSGYRRALAGA